MTKPARMPEIPATHCKHCPTAQCIRHGHDPESFDIIRSKPMVEAEIEAGSDLYCPWRKAPCVVYPVELRWAKEWHDAGLVPPVELSDLY